LDQVGRYQILEELGRGAHGVVYKALDPAIGRTVAIKSITLDSANAADGERVREGILREARLAGTLSHPNIVTVYDVQDNGSSAYIFMEFVDGKTLEQAIAATSLSRAEFLSAFRQIAGALDYAHRKGVIHRDVKPANIVLTGQRGDSDVLAKIADFGVAKFASHEVTQSLIGTPNYMSPEQVQGAALTGSSDQFSLGVMAYEVLCGRKAFAADTMEAVLYRIRNEREEAVDTVNPSLSPTVRKVMQRALEKNPNERFSTCGEFAGALEFALGDSPKWMPGVVSVAPPPAQRTVALAPVETPTEEPEKSGGRKLALIALLGLAVALAIILIVRMNSGATVTTQILDPKSGPVSATPAVEELKYDRRVPTPQLDTPTVVNVPVPSARKKVPPPKKIVAAALPVPADGEVQLLTDPPGANVSVAGLNSCTTPCSLTLAHGRHTLAATMDGFGTARKIFYLPADVSVFVPMVRSVGVLLVSSEPSGANVNVDGQAVGSTPVTLRLAPGSHRVSVWDGVRWHEQNVLVAADEVHTRTFRF